MKKKRLIPKFILVLVIFLIPCLLLSSKVFGLCEGDSLRITVFDSRTGRPWPNALIQFEKTRVIGITDSLGRAIIEWKYFEKSININVKATCHKHKHIHLKHGIGNIEIYLRWRDCYIDDDDEI
ncbi:hypothetical protein DN068_07055 [Taibaiella soli]|uniref:Uncharacterized protein n=1 Tax=Taibaiella soli TaxID=1649169 RepID=A0A2W2B179_9BACT|nr:hypothetical protein DN068_07055 [Taibaiella soli]